MVRSPKHKLVLWLLTTTAFVLLSPKWLFVPISWVAPALLLYMLKTTRGWRSFLFGWLSLTFSGWIASHGVLPFPAPFFYIMVAILSAVKIIPFFIAAWIMRRANSGWSTLAFPSALVVSEYLDSLGGGGTWGSFAYNLVTNNLLMQVTSYGGIWMITFLIGWFAAVVVWVVDRSGYQWSDIKGPVIGFSLMTIGYLAFAYIHLQRVDGVTSPGVRIAGITGSTVELVKGMYESYYDTTVQLDIDKLSQTSPELMELQKGFIHYLESPRDIRFSGMKSRFQSYYDSLFNKARSEALAGARFIVYSEGLFIVLKQEEDDLINRASQLARTHHVYIALSMASLMEGKVQMGTPFMVNKIVFINPLGEVESTFVKNRPVPLVEGSVPGDGNIPAIDTPYGRVGLSICYDADFPGLMRKAGKQQIDILILPSGDWKEISPYHAQMASVRAIENGFNLVRIASGAQSVTTDAAGRTLATSEFYNNPNRTLTAYVPTRGLRTLYALAGDWVVYLSVVGFLILFGAGIKNRRAENDKSPA